MRLPPLFEDPFFTTRTLIDEYSSKLSVNISYMLYMLKINALP